MTTPITDAKDPQSLDKPSALEFDDVAFKYADAQKDALEGVNFKLHAGQTVAIIGGTGSGKINVDQPDSAVFMMLLKVKLKSMALMSGTQLWQPFTRPFHLSRKRRTCLKERCAKTCSSGMPRQLMNRFGMLLRLRKPVISVKELDGQLDAHVEQGGANFSGGQRQRLAIARALVKQASVYVFDDSFSGIGL